MNLLFFAAPLTCLAVLASLTEAQQYSYDALGRLAVSQTNGVQSAYQYDPVGNLMVVQASNATFLATRSLSPMLSSQGLMEFEIDSSMVGSTAQEFSISGLPPGIELLNPSSFRPDGSPSITVSSGPGSTTTRIKLQFRSSVSPPPDFTPVLSVVSSSVLVPPNPDLSISGLRRMEDGKVRVDFTCVPKKRYIIQSSADLKTWTNVSEAIEATGPTLVWQGKVDETGTGASKNGFYRVIQVQ